MRASDAAEAGLAVSPRDKNFVTSLQKGLEVLTCFDRTHPRMGVSDVARRTGMSPASARRALLTLQALRYLEGDGKRFWMQPKCLLVANAFLSSRPATSLAQPLLDALSERTRESASMAQLLDDHAIIIARSTARRSLSVGLGLGSLLPAYCSALGRMLLAGLRRDAAQALVQQMALVRLTERTMVDVDDVMAQIDEARTRGYSVSDGELELAVRSMAVPVFNRSGHMVAAISIAVRADRASVAEMKHAFLPALLKSQALLQTLLFDR